MNQLPVVYSAHHAAWSFGPYTDRCALDEFSKLRYCDIGTKEVAPVNGLATLYSEVSRGVVDCNRALTDATLFPVKDFNRPTPQAIWKENQQLNDEEKQEIKARYYDSYHESILKSLLNGPEQVYLIAIDNTAPYIVGEKEDGTPLMMPTFILSNNGDEDETIGRNVTCDPLFLKKLGNELSTLMSANGFTDCEVLFNSVYTGGYIVKNYSNYSKTEEFLGDKKVQSLQIEYNYNLTHDFETMEEIPGRTKLLQEIISQAIANTIFN